MTLRNSFDADKSSFARSAALCEKRIKAQHDEAYVAKQHESIQNKISLVGTTFDDLWYMGKSIGAFIKGVDPFIDAIPWLAVFATVLSSLFRLSSTFLGKKNLASRFLTVSASVAAIGLGIAFLVVPVFTAAFIISTNIIDFFMATWEFAHTTHDFKKESRQRQRRIAQLEDKLTAALDDPIKFALFKQYRADKSKTASEDAKYDSIHDIIFLDKSLTQASNENRKANGDYANTVQTYIVSTISRIASIVFFFFPPVGAGLLLATGVYGVLDRFHLNPIKWGLKKILGKSNPFAAQTHHLSVAQLEKRVKPHVLLPHKLQELKTTVTFELRAPQQNNGAALRLFGHQKRREEPLADQRCGIALTA